MKRFIIDLAISMLCAGGAVIIGYAGTCFVNLEVSEINWKLSRVIFALAWVYFFFKLFDED